MNEMLQEMTKQTERQIALYQTLSIVGFLVGLVSVLALVCIAYGVHRIAAALENEKNKVAIDNTQHSTRPTPPCPILQPKKEPSDEEAVKWLNNRT